MRDGVTLRDVRDFEQRHHVQLCQEMVEYFTRFDGLASSTDGMVRGEG